MHVQIHDVTNTNMCFFILTPTYFLRSLSFFISELLDVNIVSLATWTILVIQCPSHITSSPFPPWLVSPFFFNGVSLCLLDPPSPQFDLFLTPVMCPLDFYFHPPPQLLSRVLPQIRVWHPADLYNKCTGVMAGEGRIVKKPVNKTKTL